MRVLLLGGTAEARLLAARLHPAVDVISSLAGRVPDPALPVGEVRIGGFGGADGMRRWLADSKVDAVVDATHPFAATITATAAEVCANLQIPHLLLARPAWPPGDAILVESDRDAAKAVQDNGFARVFLTTGRSGVEGVRRRRRMVSDPRRHRAGPADPAASPCFSCCHADRTATTTSTRCSSSIASTVW